ncbi:MAG: guanylate kinase [Niabella sp.]
MISLNKRIYASKSDGGGGFANKLIIITAPSGAGKTSITKYLLQQIPQLSFSISAATRKARKGEVSGKDYYFMSVDEFNNKIKTNEFLEWEMVYEGKYYGTLRSEIDRLWQERKYPLLDIDVKGAIHVKEQYGEQCLTIFIEPPSVRELASRLASRGTETGEMLQTRISKAEYEMSFSDQFDKSVLNDDLQEACTEAEKIVKKFLGM